jgi:hypothetical protein
MSSKVVNFFKNKKSNREQMIKDAKRSIDASKEDLIQGKIDYEEMLKKGSFTLSDSPYAVKYLKSLK